MHRVKLVTPRRILFSRSETAVHVRNFAAKVEEMLRNNQLEAQREFEAIKEYCLANYTCNRREAEAAEQLGLNRYKDILPYDCSRVELICETPHQSDYINASRILGLDGRFEFIASQGPKPETVGDHWRMIRQFNVSVVIMVTQVTEAGCGMCERYWPERLRASAVYSGVEVTLMNENPQGSYIERKLIYRINGRQVIVTHLQFTKWPHRGMPDIGEFSEFFEATRELIHWNFHDSPSSPILVHCSAGVGRTGTFIALDLLVRGLRQKTYLDVYSTVLKLRKRRCMMVRTYTQLAFIYKFLLHYLRHHGKLKAAEENVPSNS